MFNVNLFAFLTLLSNFQNVGDRCNDQDTSYSRVCDRADYSNRCSIDKIVGRMFELADRSFDNAA